MRSPGSHWVWYGAAKLDVKGETWERGVRRLGRLQLPGRKGCDPCSRQEGEQPPGREYPRVWVLILSHLAA